MYTHMYSYKHTHIYICIYIHKCTHVNIDFFKKKLHIATSLIIFKLARGRIQAKAILRHSQTVHTHTPYQRTLPQPKIDGPLQALQD